MCTVDKCFCAFSSLALLGPTGVCVYVCVCACVCARVCVYACVIWLLSVDTLLLEDGSKCPVY